jgi:UDP-N-acetylmuramoylalanine--D-glutamate ligase
MHNNPQVSVAGAHVVIVGAARSGVAAAELVARRGASVTLTERRPRIDEAERVRALGIRLALGGHDREAFDRADLIVLSPGVSPRLPVIENARQAGVPVISEIELASRWLRGRIVAVTGTKGKSTTTVLIGRMLDAAGRAALVGGNVGTALSSQVEQSTPEVIHVVEVSSFQLELTVTFHPWIAVLLNFSADHLDRHASLEEYADAKTRIFANQTEADAMVINADDPYVLEMAKHGRARVLPFALDTALAEGIVVDGGAIAHRSSHGIQPLIPLSAIKLLGRHLLADVMAATGAAALASVPAEAMTRAVASFPGLEHTLEPAGEVAGVRFVNDSKATNIEAARRAIECFPHGLVLILGGHFKGGSFQDLSAVLAGRADALVAIGEARPLIREALVSAVRIEDAESMREAVRAAFRLAKPGGTVLLAPACASLDMFTDYAERGRVFKQEVERLAEELRTRREG